jgi:beta-phosphoglucomutase-like phosphatase (HAD superfamily)
VTGTEDIYVEIFSNIFSKYDKIYTSEVREKVLGTMEKDSCAILVKELDLPISPEELMAQQRQLQKEMLPETKLMPGTINTFLHPHVHRALQGCQ